MHERGQVLCLVLGEGTGDPRAAAGDPDAAGDVEVGYSTAPAWRRQGVAGEALRGLLAWAASQGARRCLASIRPDNVASQRTIAPLGFVVVGEEVDEADGLEVVYALELT